MTKYSPSGYVILNIEEYPVVHGETTTITDKNLIERLKSGKPVLCTADVDDGIRSLWLSRSGNELYGFVSNVRITISFDDDKIEVYYDEL